MAEHLRDLGATNDAFADDDGTAPASVRAALQTAVATGTERDYLSAVAELCLCRILVPILATGEEFAEAGDPDRGAEMSAVLLQRADGERAMLAFTGVDALTEWNRRARPIPATLDKVAEACLQSGAGVLLVDFEGPHPIVLERELLTELAQSHRLARLADGNFAWLAARSE